MGYSTAENENITIKMSRYEFKRHCDTSESTISLFTFTERNEKVLNHSSH